MKWLDSKLTNLPSRTTCLWLAAVTPIIALLATGCSHNEQGMMPPPPTVTVAPVEQRELVEWQEFTGHVEPVESVEIRAKVSGYVQEVRFKSGQMVKKGDVLFTLDSRWLRADYERLQAEADRAGAQAENARRDADRARELLTSKTISNEEADSKFTTYEAAKAALDSAKAARDFAKLDLDHSEVTSPIDGKVSRELVTTGNYITGTAGLSTLLTTVVSVDPVYVYADMDEDSLLHFNSLVKSGKIQMNADGKVPAELQLADETEFSHRGEIESLDNHLDTGTGSIIVRSIFPNADGKILPGLFARIRIPLSEKYNAMLVREQAIGTDQAQKFVMSLSSSNTVEYHPVKLGPLIEGKRVIRSGVTAGQSIVVNGIAKIFRPGTVVTPVQEQAVKPDSVKVAEH